VPGGGLAWFAVQALLGLAQYLISSLLAVLLYSSIVALVRTEVDAPLRVSATGA
jgi:hypothetical protein